MKQATGHKVWAIAEGYIPAYCNRPELQFTSHETACILNTSDQYAHVKIWIYFSNRDPTSPCEETVQARRPRHLRFNDLKDPEPVPPDTDFTSIFDSDAPVVVQHTRLNYRQSENALLSTMAFLAV